MAESGGIPKREMSFDDKTIRAAFVRKVFMLVAVMLTIVTVMTAFPMIHKPTQEFIRGPSGLPLYWLSFFTFFGVYIALICCENVRRSYPSNIICTMILAVAIGYMTMMISSFKAPEVVLLCLVITTISCGGIIIFSMQTKIDFTNMMGFMAVAGLVLMVFGFVAIISMMFFHTKTLYLIYAGLAALFFMMYLAIDIQMLMGGRKYELSPEEHIFAAIQIFLDIVYIFWMLLSLFGNNN